MLSTPPFIATPLTPAVGSAALQATGLGASLVPLWLSPAAAGLLGLLPAPGPFAPSSCLGVLRAGRTPFGRLGLHWGCASPAPCSGEGSGQRDETPGATPLRRVPPGRGCCWPEPSVPRRGRCWPVLAPGGRLRAHPGLASTPARPQLRVHDRLGPTTCPHEPCGAGKGLPSPSPSPSPGGRRRAQRSAYHGPPSRRTQPMRSGSFKYRRPMSGAGTAPAGGRGAGPFKSGTRRTLRSGRRTRRIRAGRWLKGAAATGPGGPGAAPAPPCWWAMEPGERDALSVRERLFHDWVRECLVSAGGGGSARLGSALFPLSRGPAGCPVHPGPSLPRGGTAPPWQPGRHLPGAPAPARCGRDRSGSRSRRLLLRHPTPLAARPLARPLRLLESGDLRSVSSGTGLRPGTAAQPGVPCQRQGTGPAVPPALLTR